MTPERLRTRWELEAAQVGLARGRQPERQVEEAGRGQRRRLTASDLGELFDRLVDPEEGLCARDSRFGEAQVIEQVAAFWAGQLTFEQIQRLATAFLRSDRVVRLIDRDPSGRTRPGGRRSPTAGSRTGSSIIWRSSSSGALPPFPQRSSRKSSLPAVDWAPIRQRR
jgi:hypothetical protein